MNLNLFDGKCVRILTASGEEYEGTVSYCGREYVFHEYGRDQDALLLTPILFYQEDIARIESLEDVAGPYGHFSAKYGLLEKKCLDWGTDLIEEVFDSEDDAQILRMLACMKDHLQPLAERAVRGKAPWRFGGSIPQAEDEAEELGPIYLGELEELLGTLVKISRNAEIVQEAKDLLDRFAKMFPEKAPSERALPG